MKGFNLSEWAINHRPFVWFLMILFVAAGVLSYKQLGREEDPSFSIKTMIVRTYWPGATIDDTMLQITDRIEKKLQETPSLYYLKSETKPGVSTIYVNVLDSTPKEAIPDIWYQVRKKVADIKSTLPQGILGPSFNDEFGDVFGIIYAFTADGFTHRELRDYVERIRTQILTIKNAAKAQLIGAQDQKFYLEFDTHQLAGLGVSRDDVISSLQEQNAVTPSGVVQTGLEKYAIRVSGAFSSVDDLKRINLYANGKFFRLADVASISKGYSDPPQPMFRFNGEPAIGLAISMAQGGNNLVFGEAVAHKMEQIIGKLPIGIEAHLVADQPVVVEEAVGGFTKALWEAIAIVLARQLREPRSARRSGRRLLDPARARNGLCLHGVFRHQPAAHLARGADHCARPPRRRRDDHDRDDGQPARGGGRPRAFGHACLGHDGFSDADRNARHGRRICADRLREERRRRILLLAVRGHCRRAVGFMDRRGTVCAGNRRYDPAKDDEGPWRRPCGNLAVSCGCSAPLSSSACAPAGSSLRSLSGFLPPHCMDTGSSSSNSSRPRTGRSWSSISTCLRTRRFTRPSTKSSGSRRC